MNILFLEYSFAAGGAQRQLVNLMNSLAGSGYQIHLSLYGSYHKPKTFFLDNLHQHIKIHNFSNSREKVSFYLFLKLFFICRKYKIELIYCNSWGCNLIGSIVGFLSRIRIVTCQLGCHSDSFKYISIYRHLCTAFSPNSQKAADILVNRYHISREKVFLIHQGIDLEYFTPNAAQQAVLIEPLSTRVKSKFVFINVARIHVHKDHMTLLKAISHLPPETSEQIFFLIAGHPESSKIYSELKLYIEAHSISNVAFLGERKDVRELLSISNAFILSSQTEGFPNVVIEAISMGLPVISTNVGDVGDLIHDGKNGFLVEPKNYLQMARRISQLVELPQKQLERMKAYSKDISNFFSTERFIQKSIAMFESVLH